MRRPLTIAVALLAAAGCDDSSSSSETLTGTLFGESFTPVEVAYVGPADAACSFPTNPPVAYANSAVLIAFSATPGICDRAADPCTGQKNLTFVAGTVAHAKLATEVAPGLQPGTYTIYANPTDAMPDQNLEIRAAVLAPIQSGNDCAETSGAAGEGTIRLDSIGPGELRGHVDVTFPDGGSLKGPFVAARCETTFDVCAGSPSACGGDFVCP